MEALHVQDDLFALRIAARPVRGFHVRHVLHEIVDHRQALWTAPKVWAALDEGLGVVVPGVFENLLDGVVFPDDAIPHDYDLVGELTHDVQVVGDEQYRHAPRLLEVSHKLEDLLLDGHVQGRGGLVCDEELGLAGDGHGDHHALLLAARELVGIAVDAFGRIGQPAFLEERDGPQPGFTAANARVQHQRLDDLLPHREHGIERGHGFLEDHGDLAAADLPELVGSLVEEFTPLEEDFTAGPEFGIGGQEPQDGHGGDGLAGTGFSHQGHRAVPGDVEADALEGLERLALLHAEGHAQVLDGYEGRLAGHHFTFGSSASRMLSFNMLNAVTRMDMNRVTQAICHQ